MNNTTALMSLWGVEEKDFRSFTEEEKDNLKKYIHNFCLSLSGILRSENHILIANMETWDNWKYYAGLEYLNRDDYSIYQHEGEFAVLLCRTANEKLEILFDTLEKQT